MRFKEHAPLTEQYVSARIVEQQLVGRGLTRLVLDRSLPTAAAGQYILLWIPRFDEKPFMITDASPLTIVVKEQGPFTQLLSDQAINTQLVLRVRGPLGRCASSHDKHGTVHCVEGPVYDLQSPIGDIE